MIDNNIYLITPSHFIKPQGAQALIQLYEFSVIHKITLLIEVEDYAGGQKGVHELPRRSKID